KRREELARAVRFRMEGKYSILPAYLHDEEMLVYCLFCDQWHRYGGSRAGGDRYRKYPGWHRYPHCHQDTSPFKDIGYFVWWLGADVPKFALTGKYKLRERFCTEEAVELCRPTLLAGAPFLPFSALKSYGINYSRTELDALCRSGSFP